jgi:hypothetical protein
MLVFEGKVDQNCTVLGSRYHCDKNKHWYSVILRA